MCFKKDIKKKQWLTRKIVYLIKYYNKETREKVCFEILVTMNPFVKVLVIEGNILVNIKRSNLSSFC